VLHCVESIRSCGIKFSTELGNVVWKYPWSLCLVILGVRYLKKVDPLRAPGCTGWESAQPACVFKKSQISHVFRSVKKAKNRGHAVWNVKIAMATGDLEIGHELSAWSCVSQRIWIDAAIYILCVSISSQAFPAKTALYLNTKANPDQLIISITSYCWRFSHESVCPPAMF